MPPSSSEPRKWKKKRKSQYEEDVSNDETEDDDASNPIPTPALPEIVSDAAVRISEFPAAVRRTVERRHHSVAAMTAIENLSHGQLQAVSVVPRGYPMLMPLGERDAGMAETDAVVAPPPIVGGSGVVKRFRGRVLVVPMHADWFSTHKVHRLERQVVPRFFHGKSAEDTPEKYMECRNRILEKYMENPERRLSLADCQGWAAGFESDDLARVVRFLDNWGIINYCASAPEPQSDGLFLREDSNGEIPVPSVALKSIDSLIQFEKPKCKLKPADIYPSLSCHNHEEADLDSRIREHLSENRCNYCSNPVPIVYYQSQKEEDLLLCVDCYNDGRFVIGHSSIDFVRLDTSRDNGDIDGESWTNQETLLLLEAMEIYEDNWNEIAEYVGSKSKAQCILHFIRLPTEDGPLEKVEVPGLSLASNKTYEDLSSRPQSNSNGDSAGSCDPDLESELPFANSANPVMSLVAFLASTVGPRVAAACAHSSLVVLSEDSQKEFEQIEDFGVSKRINADTMQSNKGYSLGEYTNSEDNSDMNGRRNQNGEFPPLSADKVRTAVKAGLSAAATKAKLFADHEEREIQRLSANIIHHQLKKLELKLKKFADVDALLTKESEQIENWRLKFSGERSRMMSAQFGGSPNNAMANRQPLVTASSQPFVSSGYNNHPQIHPNIMGRQQMYGHGPRLPLSALHPSSSVSPNAMFNSQANAQPSTTHQMLRSVSGTSSSLGQKLSD